MKIKDLTHAHVGRGITFFDIRRIDKNGYFKVAHIDEQRQIKFDTYVNPDIAAYISYYAATSDPYVSAAKTKKVFSVPPYDSKTLSKILEH